MSYLGREAAKAPIVTADIPDDSITSAKIVDATVAAGDLAANSVDSSELVDGSVDLSHMNSESVDEDNLHISNAGSNGEFLSKQSGNAGGMTWAAAGGSTSASDLDSGTLAVARMAAGTIIQTTALVGGTTITTISSPAYSGSWASTVVTGSITPLYSDSSIIVHAKFTTKVVETGGDHGYSYKFYRTATGLTASYPDGVSGDGDQDDDRTTSRHYRNPFNYSSLADGNNLSWMDANVTIADTAVTYTLYISTYAVDTSITVGADSNGRWDIFFQEIKR